MPYIITTRHPQRTVWEGPRSRVVTEAPPTRTAVATMDEARLVAGGIWQKHLGYRKYGPTENDFKRYGDWAVPESGGTIGPLPDGTVIEVQPLHWDELRAAAKVPSTTSDSMTVTAFNRKQA